MAPFPTPKPIPNHLGDFFVRAAPFPNIVDQGAALPALAVLAMALSAILSVELLTTARADSALGKTGRAKSYEAKNREVLHISLPIRTILACDNSKELRNRPSHDSLTNCCSEVCSLSNARR